MQTIWVKLQKYYWDDKRVGSDVNNVSLVWIFWLLWQLSVQVHCWLVSRHNYHFIDIDKHDNSD